jgi:hypothetical protein
MGYTIRECVSNYWFQAIAIAAARRSSRKTLLQFVKYIVNNFSK